LNKSGYQVKVIWYVLENDEDMQETGVDYQTIIEMPFEFIAVIGQN